MLEELEQQEEPENEDNMEVDNVPQKPSVTYPTTELPSSTVNNVIHADVSTPKDGPSAEDIVQKRTSASDGTLSHEDSDITTTLRPREKKRLLWDGMTC